MNLEILLKEFENKLDYSDAIVSFSEYEESLEDDDWITVSSEEKGIYLNISMNKKGIVGRISAYQRILQIMVFLSLALIPILYIFLRYLLILPLRKINSAHLQIKRGNRKFRIMGKANSVEYQDAYQSFNQMVDNLESLRFESYEKEISKQRMELRNLQLQIRPHFLLNAFNLIYTLVQRKEMKAVQDVILYLSSYFRYIFRHDRELDLFANELKLVKGYMKMVSISYLGKVRTKYKLNEEIKSVYLPPLLIHNFIENSVKHGMKQGVILNITIIGEYINDVVTINIIDDGIGMDEAQLEKIKKLLRGEIEPDNPHSHIGFLNSIRRIKHFYGEYASIKVSSEKSKKTYVMIQFPYKKEDYDEFTND